MASQIIDTALRYGGPIVVGKIAYDTFRDSDDSNNQKNQETTSVLTSASAASSNASSAAPINANTKAYTRNFDGIKLTLQESSSYFVGITLTVTNSPLGKMNNFSVTNHKWSADSSREACFTEITNRVNEVYGCCCKFFCKYFCCCC